MNKNIILQCRHTETAGVRLVSYIKMLIHVANYKVHLSARCTWNILCQYTHCILVFKWIKILKILVQINDVDPESHLGPVFVVFKALSTNMGATLMKVRFPRLWEHCA